MSDIKNETQTAFEAGVMAAPQREVQNNGVPYLVVPEGHNVVDLETMLRRPLRKRGTTMLEDMASFVEVVKDQRDDDSKLFVTGTLPDLQFAAVFDCHGAGASGEAGWREHKAMWRLTPSAQCVKWMGVHKTYQNQQQLADFIEDNLVDVLTPDGAELLETARTLRVTRNVDVKSAVHLANGSVQFAYNEEMTAKGGTGGNLEVPGKFTISIPLWKGGQRCPLSARLRWQLDGQRPLFKIEFTQLDATLEQAEASLVAQVKVATGMDVLRGHAG